MQEQTTTGTPAIQKNKNVRKHNRWGYYFLIPFFVVYVVFQLVPLASTIYYSFYEKYRVGLMYIENYAGFQNYIDLIKGGLVFDYMKNTAIMWILGFIPQILVSLLLGAWFSDNRLKLRAAGFYKVVIYLPNIIMASAFAKLFQTMFALTGPVNQILTNIYVFAEPFKFDTSALAERSLIGFMNFLMWFGNTTILLMAGMMGIDTSLFEAAEVDGANSTQKFWKITIPLLRPILLFVVITSLIGGIQMFDVPQILTKSQGNPNKTTMSIIMYLNRNLTPARNYGVAGALSVMLFIVTAILSLIVFKVSGNSKKVK